MHFSYFNYNFNDTIDDEALGTLILRNPLPSVVYTRSENIPRKFIIKDTKKALGFQVKMAFLAENAIKFPDNPQGIKYCLTGYFEIKNYNNTYKLWRQLIPNSIINAI